MALLVVFPVDVVQVAGQFCVAQRREEGRKSFGQDGPVRRNAADGGAYADLVPPDATEAARNRFICQVQVHMRRQPGKVGRAFGIAEDVQFCNARGLHEPPRQAHGYIEDAYRFGGGKTLVCKREKQFHTCVRTLAYFAFAVKFFQLCACGSAPYLV